MLFRSVSMVGNDIKEESAQAQDVQKSEEVGEKQRGRRRSRAQSDRAGKGQGTTGDAENGRSSGEEGEDGPDGPRKRRRSRKGLDKKFPCKDCEKSYSRAEHL